MASARLRAGTLPGADSSQAGVGPVVAQPPGGGQIGDPLPGALAQPGDLPDGRRWLRPSAKRVRAAVPGSTRRVHRAVPLLRRVGQALGEQLLELGACAAPQ